MNGAVVGRLTTVDEDSSQTHTYFLNDGAGGRFSIFGDKIRVSQAANLDYETASRYTISVTSADSGSPTMSIRKNFVIEVLDVNERPTTVMLSANRVRENSGAGTTIGNMSVTDPDNAKPPLQTFTYALLESAGGRFRLDNNVVKVDVSNVRCLAFGGEECLLNYEEENFYSISVRAIDSGSPSLFVDATFNITLSDENDKPRNLRLSNDNVRENSVIGTSVGLLSVTDEDEDNVTFSLSRDDNGMFRIVGNQLQTAQMIDHEFSKGYNVTVLARDNGSPPLSVNGTVMHSCLRIVC